jgi:hypothetical protein
MDGGIIIGNTNEYAALVAAQVEKVQAAADHILSLKE